MSGGVRRYVGEKIRALRERGGRHVLIIPGERDEVSGDDLARVYTIASPCISRVTQYRVLLRLGEIRRILAAEKPDIVESGDPYQVGFAVARHAAELGIPCVAFYHSHFAESEVRPLRHWLGETTAELCVSLAARYARRFYWRFSRTLVASPQLAQTLAGWGIANTVHIDLGVDAVRFHSGNREAARAALGIPAGARVLLSVGRLAAEKNTRLLCDTFRRLDGYHLLITGEGLQRDAVERLVAETGAVTWLPFLGRHEDLLRLFHAADLFVHPGVQETFGLVTLEAQACGLPVVGIRGTPMDRIVCHTQDFWAQENSAAALAGAIENAFQPRRGAVPAPCDDVGDASRLWGAGRFPSLESLGATARTAVLERFSWPVVMSRLFDIYREVIHEHS